MRLSGWRKTAPTMESLGGDVVAMLKPVLMDLGADADPTCWVVWGEDPQLRYSVLVPTLAGLIIASVRTSGPEGGPRASAKVTRWSKLTVSDLALESTGGHRIVAVQVESLVLKGVDDEADRICEFVRGLIAEIDDRHPQPVPIAVAHAAVAGSEVATTAGPAAMPAAAAAVPPKPALKVVPKAAPKATSKVAPKATSKVAPKPAPKPAPKRAAARPDPADIAMDAFRSRPAAVPPPAATAAIPLTAAGQVSAPAPAPVAAPAAGPVAAPAAEPVPGPKAAPVAKPAPHAARPAEKGPEALPALGPGPAATPADGKPGPAGRVPEVEVDRSSWIPPHPIAASTHKPHKPRPWRP